MLAAPLLAFACTGDRSRDLTPGTTRRPELVRVEYGQLVDVYGLAPAAEGAAVALFRRDVVIGADIRDERPSGSNASDGEITYDFIASDPDTLQPRLLIPRAVDSDAFRTAFAALGERLRLIAPMRFGEADRGLPFPVVPRNAALRLTFSAPLGVDDGFFVERDPQSRQVTALRNTEAVQLLRIVGDPEQPNAFVPMPVRVIVYDRELVLDPVLLGTEGLQYQTLNNAAGMPASPDQLGANMRIAVALEGPLAIPGLRESETNGRTGLNNSARRSVVRDFRSGNADDESADIVRGFLRDPLPLRIVGEIPMYLERVDEIDARTQEITVFKNGLSHEIDRGDVLRIVADGSGLPFGAAEVVVDPGDDRDDPTAQHVRVRIRRLDGLAAVDPRNLPGYPAALAEREPWLVQNAPRAVCIAEFTAGGVDGRDDPRNFLTFSPEPLERGGVRPQPNEFVSPFADVVVRFTKPVDLATARWADTFFFAMRDLTTKASIDEFVQNRPNNLGGVGMEPATFDAAKYRTPFLIAARLFDADGSQTALRLQPTKGFYLDDTMRNPPAGADYRYFVHLIADSDDGGIRDLAGNRLDLMGTTAARNNAVVIPFTVDTRMDGDVPLFADNLAVSLVRRFASRDEDARPSWFRPSEVQAPGTTSTAATVALDDLFGAFLYLDDRLLARPTTRTRTVADNLNQSPIVQQPPRRFAQNPLAWCPQTVFSNDPDPRLTDDQRAVATASNLTAGPIQNPLNPAGCRLQTLWREIDLSLSRVDPADFDLDIEQLYWAPFQADIVRYDEFDRTSLWLGHSEYRPAPCVGDFSALPSLPESGLRAEFERNFAWNPQPNGTGSSIETQSPRRAAYVDAPLRIDPALTVLEPNGINRYLPLPTFQRPLFVWRDQTVAEQGGNAGIGSDLQATVNATITLTHAPYVLSPFTMGQGSRWIDRAGARTFVPSYWNDAVNYQLTAPLTRDTFTGGLCGSIALPLLADFWTYYDSDELPAGDGFFAFGSNGWQTALALTSDPRPRFRVLSAGRPRAAPQGELAMGPSNQGWVTAVGGWGPNPNGAAQPWVPVPPPPPGLYGYNNLPDIKGDNTFYWVMMDVLRRQTVATSGFVDLYDPHRVPAGFADVRLGPFFLVNGAASPPPDVLPTFAPVFDPPLSRLPGGTSIVAQFRGAGDVDPDPWYWRRWIAEPTTLFPAPTIDDPGFVAAERAQLLPTPTNFPLDPFKAGDAQLRKWDTRGGRNWWTYLYNRTVTRYVEDPNDLMDPAFTIQFQGPNEVFRPRDVRYVNWRLVMANNPDATPPTSPSIDTFALSYRFEPR